MLKTAVWAGSIRNEAATSSSLRHRASAGQNCSLGRHAPSFPGASWAPLDSTDTALVSFLMLRVDRYNLVLTLRQFALAGTGRSGFNHTDDG